MIKIIKATHQNVIDIQTYNQIKTQFKKTDKQESHTNIQAHTRSAT